MAVRKSQLIAAGVFVAIGIIGVFVAGRLAPPATSQSSTSQSAEAKRLAESEFTIVPEGDRSSFPAFAGSTVDGADWNSAQLTGIVTVVNLWASWCGPCEEEWPVLQDAAVRYTDVRWLGVNTMDRNTDAQQFLAAHPSPYGHVHDPDASIMTRLHGVPNRTLPVTVILDTRARIAAWKSGPVTREQLDRGIAAVR